MAEDKVEIELEGIGKLGVRQRKLTEEEKKEKKKNSQESLKLLQKIESSGKWWKSWEREDIREYLADTGCEDTAETSIKELKRVFTDEWFRLSSEGHPIKISLLYPGLHGLSHVVPLGSAIREMGGTDNLLQNVIKDLKSKENYYHRAYELETLAFLKVKEPSIRFEHELNLEKTDPKPDAKTNKAYYEIKDLSTSEYENTSHDMLKEINDYLEEKFKAYRGIVACSIDLGSPENLENLDKAIQAAKSLIDSSALEDRKASIAKKGTVSVNLKQVPCNIRGRSCNIINYGQFQVIELHRIARKIRESAIKNPGDLPLIVIVKPSTPMLVFAKEDKRKILGAALFKSALSQEPQVRTVKELWIDLTILEVGKMKRMLSDHISSFDRTFIEISNPFLDRKFSRSERN